MNGVPPRRIRLDQCEASVTIRARFGLRSAFDYLVLEKLMNFAEAAGTAIVCRLGQIIVYDR
jgi:2-hydroxychromene-2-carboxylate isomerase